MKNLLNILLVLLVFSMPLSAQEKADGIKFITEQSFEDVLKKAKAENKPIFIDCYADWCGPCKTLSKDVFPLKEVGDVFNKHFINVKYNVEKGEGISFAKKHQKDIPGLPTMLFINSDGEIMHSVVGARSPEALIKEAEMVLSGKTFVSIEKRYLDGERDVELVSEYVAALNSAYKKEEVKKVVEEFTANLPVESLLEPAVWEMSKSYINNPYSADYHFVLDNMMKYAYNLEENIEKLESQLRRGMTAAIKDIMPRFKDEAVSEATLDSVSVLKDVLRKNVLKQSADMLGKFEIAEYMKNDEPMKVFNFISFALDVNLYKGDAYYLEEIYQYIGENIDDPQVLRESLDVMNRLQQDENNSYIPANFYKTIVLVNNKLGNTEEAKIAQEKSEELDAKIQEKVDGFAKIFEKTKK